VCDEGQKEMSSSRRLEDLHPDMLPRVQTFLAAARLHGIDLLVTCTWRSPEEQARLYAQGRTTPGKRVTNAKPGQSMHNYMLNGLPASLAVDVVPLRSGKPVWAAADPVWQEVGKHGEAASLEWAGRWTRFREFPHFQHFMAASIRRSKT
jgi:peptidoglycan L-alanyl-D-glutamate endopeptidase CwlK